MDNISLVDRIYYDLRKKILVGELKQGSKIGERLLSDEYEASRTPIREAVKRLEQDGWVEILPKKGTFVKTIDSKSIVETNQLRIMIEPQALVMALPNITDDKIEKIKNNLEEMYKATLDNNIEDFLVPEIENHRIIIESTGNELLKKVIFDMYNNILRLGSKSVQIEERRKVSCSEWEKIIHYIENKDAFNASNYLKLHLISSSEASLKFF